MQLTIVGLGIALCAGLAWDCFRRWIDFQHTKLREESDGRVAAHDVDTLSKRLDVHEGALKQALTEIRAKFDDYDTKVATVVTDAETRAAAAIDMTSPRSWGR